MKACVFVDSENFRGSINDLFNRDKRKFYLPEHARWGDFFDYIVAESSGHQAKRLRTYWYVVDFPAPSPRLRDFPQSSDEIDEWVKRHWEAIEDGKKTREKKDLHSLTAEKIIEELLWRGKATQKRFAGYRRIQRKIAHAHSAVEFRRSGAIKHDLFSHRLGPEKTVDVNLAVDMLQLRDIYDLAVIVSGDQDYVPAVQAVKNAGKTVVNVAFTDAENNMLPGGAPQLNEVADRPLIIGYAKFAEFLGLSVKTDDR